MAMHFIRPTFDICFIYIPVVVLRVLEGFKGFAQVQDELLDVVHLAAIDLGR